MVSQKERCHAENSLEGQDEVESPFGEKSETRTSLFPIVGICASAGGLDAYKRFFSAMPADSQMAFIVVPHLDPTHRSLMVELLARTTAMKVCEAKEGMAVEPNCVYIIPPNNYLTINQGLLRLANAKERRGLTVALDGFLRSLAEDQQENAIGVILSGTGSHGTSGLMEIKAAGGLVMAQDPDTAEYHQMPGNAINAGIVDFVLPPEKMPEALINYVRQSKLQIGNTTTTAADDGEEQIMPVLDLLRTGTRFDFRLYRKNMLTRRIHRRMRIHQIAQVTDYISYLQDHPEEISKLNRDLLIGVTSFFREPDAFDVLKLQVITELVEHQTGDVPVRVWVPACSTGEEAYSIAILFMEQFAATKRPANLQLFASDIDEEAVEVARRGIYPAGALSGLSPERLKQFFVMTDESHYQVSKQLRASIVVTRQNVDSDAPFSKLDLISCRNLLIYLELELQQKILSLFHFSLNDGGKLFLGCSESIGQHSELFEPISKKWRIYRRIGPSRQVLGHVPLKNDRSLRPLLPRVEPGPRRRTGFAELTHKILLARYAPAAALINRKYEVLNLFGRTSDYLELPSGEITKDLMSLARKGLRSKIRSACQKVLGDVGSVAATAVARFSRNGTVASCQITVSLLNEPPDAKGLLLVTFQDQTDETSSRNSTVVDIEDESTLVRDLEREVENTREDLQCTVEELQTSNEEVMSMNEELQSANEELETSKEELQSFNEELSTVNGQLQDKMEELEKANNDFRNLLNGTEIATVFLDKDLKIVRFTPATAKLLHLLDSDTGRPIRDFALRFTDRTLLQDAGRVLDKLTPVETEIRSEEGRSYLRRILPFRTSNEQVDGITITFVDISERNLLQRQLLTIASEENRRIGQDLHDSVGQTLTGLSMLAASLAENLEKNSSPQVNAASRITKGLLTALEEIRKLSKGLLPVEVASNGLMIALTNLAETTSENSGIRCSFDFDIPVEIENNETATQLYRIAQEAVTNSSKCGAKNIKITLILEEDQIVLNIRDDGPGITASAWNSQGIGLKTMQYRAGLLGGSMSINPVNKRGTLVSCRIFANAKHENALPHEPSTNPNLDR